MSNRLFRMLVILQVDGNWIVVWQSLLSQIRHLEFWCFDVGNCYTRFDTISRYSSSRCYAKSKWNLFYFILVDFVAGMLLLTLKMCYYSCFASVCFHFHGMTADGMLLFFPLIAGGIRLGGLLVLNSEAGKSMEFNTIFLGITQSTPIAPSTYSSFHAFFYKTFLGNST